jgi:hypothetical protein
LKVVAREMGGTTAILNKKYEMGGTTAILNKKYLLEGSVHTMRNKGSQ